MRLVSGVKQKSAWRQKHARYRLLPVELSAFETPTYYKMKDIADGVSELRSENSVGEVLNVARRFLQPLELWHRHGLPTNLYQAGRRYGIIWREAVRPKSPLILTPLESSLTDVEPPPNRVWWVPDGEATTWPTPSAPSVTKKPSRS